jgi:nucleotide-binding universal stress UspA family protein
MGNPGLRRGAARASRDLEASVPVSTHGKPVARTFRMTPGTPIRHVLVPHDFSDTAERALAFALDLAAPLGARVTVLHVYDIPVFGFPDGVVALPTMAELAGQIERASSTALEGVLARNRREGVEVAALLRQGTAWSEINGAAADTKADLVVIGTHGRRGLSRALLGSVAEKVIRTAPCGSGGSSARTLGGRRSLG